MSTISAKRLRAEPGAWISFDDETLPTDGPARPFKAPVEICRQLWGPFHRLYLRASTDRHTHTICSGVFTTEAAPDDAMRIRTTMHVPTETGVVRAGISLLRAASGELLRTDLTSEPGGSPSDAPVLESLRESLRPTGGFLGRRSLGMGDLFTLHPDPAGMDAPRSGVPLLCRVIGETSYQGRAVIVARCSGSQAVAAPAWTGLLAAQGSVAIDIETGVVVLSTLDCRLLDATEGARDQPPPDFGSSLQLQAWFTLQ